MLRRHGPRLTTVLLVMLCVAATPVRAAEPVVRPAVDGIFAAFETHPLVALGELHMLANELTFYATLVRGPRFAEKVGNVVVEFGGSQHQDILDRYVAGKDVPYTELSKVWRNVVGWDPTVIGIGYQSFFAQVRVVNQSLPPNRQIRVLISEPPIDWSSIHTKEEWQRIYDRRDSHMAAFIVSQILDRRKKALVINGVGHFFSLPWPSTTPVPSSGTETLAEIVERSHPGAFYYVIPYGGYRKPGCSAALEARMNWQKEVLISPIRGTALQDILMQPECMPRQEGLDASLPPAERASLEKRNYEIEAGVAGDALLYLAPAAELMQTPFDPATWMDLAYYKELIRRSQLRGNPPPSFAELLPFVNAPPQPWTW